MKTYLAEWMEYRDVSPLKLAQETKVSEKMILKYLDGKPTPSLQDAVLFAGVLNITVDVLVGMTPEQKEEADAIAEAEKLQEQEMEEEADFIPITTVSTNSFKEVVRFNNYCIKNGITVDTCVIIDDTSNYTTYIMSYDGEEMDFATLAKITRKRKYATKKIEKSPSEKMYEDCGFTVVHTGIGTVSE